MAADVFERLVALLSEVQAKFRVIEHEAEGRSEKISVIRGNRPEQAAKAMVLDVRGGGGGRRHVLAILPGNRKLDFNAVASLFEARKCGFAGPESAQALTGCVMGAVPLPINSSNLGVCWRCADSVSRVVITCGCQPPTTP